jgi:DNA topoisomerase-1
MVFTLILTEKREAAERIAFALDDHGSPRCLREGEVPYFEAVSQGKTLRIVSAVGHLYTIAPKKRGYTYPVFDLDWTPAYKFRRNLGYIRKWIEAIAKLSEGASEYLSATDYDIEGELIGYMTLRFACKGQEGEAKRMVFSTLTAADLRRAFWNPRSHLDHRLVDAGEARHVVDFLWGINVSRALTFALRRSGYRFTSLSAGRVQGPALGFVLERDKHIESFAPTPYWVISATVEYDRNLYRAEHSQALVTTFEEAQRIVAGCHAQEALVKRVSSKAYQQSPPAAFSLGELQSEAYRVFRYTPSRTLKVAESLYLDALISYPRTGSERIPSAIDCRQILSALANSPVYGTIAQLLLDRNSISPVQGQGDDPAHPAIHPTGNLPAKALRREQARLFDLIVRRFLSAFGPPASWKSVRISLDLNGETFILRGKHLLDEGWLAYYRPYAIDDEMLLPLLEEGQTVPVREVSHKEMHTMPPPRYNPSSLLREMETKELGTKATRAAIIDILFERGYVAGERIAATALGRGVFETLQQYCPKLVSVELTRQLEHEMDAIQQGTITKEHVISEATDTLKKILMDFKQNE